MNIIRFEDIEAWQLARKLTNEIYAVITRGAFSKDYALRDQITKAAGSSMHNIAEGFDAESDSEFIRFLRYAKRSCTEIQSQLYVALDQSYIDQTEFDELYELASFTQSKLGAFINYLIKSKDTHRAP